MILKTFGYNCSWHKRRIYTVATSNMISNKPFISLRSWVIKRPGWYWDDKQARKDKFLMISVLTFFPEPMQSSFLFFLNNVFIRASTTGRWKERPADVMTHGQSLQVLSQKGCNSGLCFKVQNRWEGDCRSSQTLTPLYENTYNLLSLE